MIKAVKLVINLMMLMHVPLVMLDLIYLVTLAVQITLIWKMVNAFRHKALVIQVANHAINLMMLTHVPLVVLDSISAEQIILDNVFSALLIAVVVLPEIVAKFVLTTLQ